MPHRIEVFTKVNDTRSSTLKSKLKALNYNIDSAKVIDVFTINKDFDEKTLTNIADILSNPISQEFIIDSYAQNHEFTYALEIGFLPGVTDNEAHTSKETIEDLIKQSFNEEESVHTSKLIFLKGEITEGQTQEIGELLANKLIQRIHVKSKAQYERDKGMDIVVPKVKLSPHNKADIVNLNLSEEELLKLGKEGILDENGERRGPLALDAAALHAIKDYYDKESRNPTDIELESLAQTWSEHCKHTIFAAKIDDNEDGLYKGYIKKATQDIRNKKGSKDFCVSVFKDNSGGIIFDDNWVITDKAETHNSPSALDPFGGAITGIVGVNRDTIGFGLGAKPIINKFGFCVGYPEDKEPLFKDKELTSKALSPKRIFEGIIDGVKVGGNCSGIPTPQGFVYFDDSYKGKPLVFVGTIGLIPKEINGKPSWEKQAKAGDKVVVVGGRVGQDGIHGATFSSEALTSGSPATAVQIGDPITQKKLSDAIIKEARQMDLYNSITDNGAGGISCSVAEMAKECGGCDVDLDKVPLKYPNLEPWKIWISESQERMTLAIPEEKLETFMKLMEKRGVEATVIGEFNDSGRCIVKNNGEEIMNLDMGFLHDGLPRKTLTTTYTKKQYSEPKSSNKEDLTETLTEILSRPNICSFEFISHQYDHTVQAGAVIGPLQGKGSVNGPSSVTRPLLTSEKAIICSQGINAKYSHIDTYHMAACAIDTAVRNIVATGGKLEDTALMDNFCWCSSDDPERLGQLKAAAQACYDYAVAYETPYISGKDSMFNDFKGFDKEGNQIKISAAPTLLISSINVLDDATKSVSINTKFPGDLIYIIGETKNELGASEYFEYLDDKNREKGNYGNSVPKVDIEIAKSIYSLFEKATDQRLIASSLSPTSGGLGITLAKKAIAGQLGMNIDLSKVPKSSDLDRDDYLLFSESQTRFVVTIAPENKEKFESLFKEVSFAQIGEVTENTEFTVKGLNGQNLIQTDVKTLAISYKNTFKNY